jgi:hypothetical protein
MAGTPVPQPILEVAEKLRELEIAFLRHKAATYYDAAEVARQHQRFEDAEAFERDAERVEAALRSAEECANRE